MARCRYSRKKVPDNSGTVYILEIELEDVVAYKIGVTTKTVAKRALQIIEGVYKAYGYFPRVKVLKSDKTLNHFKVETRLHRLFEAQRFNTLLEFTGSTEMFVGVKLDDVVAAYEKLLEEDDDARINERIYIW